MASVAHSYFTSAFSTRNLRRDRMTVRSFKPPALTPINGYVCLACRTRNPYVNLQIRRQQHAATQPPSPSQEPPSLSFDKLSPKNQKQKEEHIRTVNQGNEEQLGSAEPEPATSKLQPRKPSPEARKLQLLLHEKFVTQRRKDAASMQTAKDLEWKSKAREAKPKKRKLRNIEKPERQANPSKKPSRRGRRAAAKQPAGPNFAQKRSPAIVAISQTSSETSPRLANEAGFVRKGGEGAKKTNLSCGTIEFGQSIEDEERSLAQHEPTQSEANKPTFLEQVKNQFRSLRIGGKAEESMSQRPPLSVSLDPEKAAPPASTDTASPQELSDKEQKSEARTSEKPLTLSRIRTKRGRKKVAKLKEKSLLVKKDAKNRANDVSKAQTDPDTVFRKILSKPSDAQILVAQATEAKARKRTSKETRLERARDIQVINANRLSITALDLEQPPVPRLSYGLERVLFNPGVYHLQDPRSRVYNFDPYLQTIMPAKEFDFNALKEYITSSRDVALRELAESYDKRYVGSSSSMTGILAHFHFLLSQWRPINTKMLSREFPEQHVTEFTELQRSPSAIFLKWRNGSYAIDADKEFASANILMLLGKSMEKLLTLDTEDFEKYRKSNPDKVPEEERKAPEAYHYSTMGDFIMRSQLDAQDPRLPGTGMFDLKTRAVVSVRMEASNYEEGSGYQIKTRQGAWESFEREFFDMIRSAFLKYSLQVRMGRMDGIFVAFHNTDRVFGFQYVSLAEMDSTLHGQWDTNLGDQEFKLSVALLNEVLEKATKKYPNTSLRLHFETRKAKTPFMYVFAEPVTEEQITAIQTAKNAEIQKFEEDIYGNKKGGNDGKGEDQSWENLEADVQSAMDDDIRDPHHEEGRQDLSSELISRGQGDLKDDGSADRHDATGENEHEESTFRGNNEDTDVRPVEDEEIDDGDSERTAMEDLRDDGEDGDEAEDDEAEVDEADQREEHGALAGEDSNSHETEERRSLEDNKSSEVTLEGRDASSDINGPEPLSSDVSSTLVDATTSQSIPEKTSSDSDGKEVLALTLTIRNKINGSNVLRPTDLKPNEQWAIEYSLDEVPNAERAWSLYQACQVRRKKKLDEDKERSENDDQVDSYIRRLRQMSRKGAKWRKEQDQKEKELPVRILGKDDQQEEDES